MTYGPTNSLVLTPWTAELRRANSLLIRITVSLLLANAALAWLVPGDRNSFSLFWDIADQIGKVVPAIEKAASVSPIRWTVYGYLAISFACLPITILGLVLCGSIYARFSYAFRRNGVNCIKTGLVIYCLYLPVVFLVFSFCYFLPVEVTVNYGPTRGQMLFAFMLESRVGLSIFGSLFFTGLSVLGWTSLVYLIGPLSLLLIARGERGE
jgi:hypothetical protein